MSAEPSMEEILSSIKRIIAEEGDGAPPRQRRPQRTAVTSPEAAPTPEPDDVTADTEEVLELSDPMPRPQPNGMAPPAPSAPTTPVPPYATPPVEPLLSTRTTDATRGSLDALTRIVVKPDAGGDGTLEGLVREMLRPMLRDWLDAKLPEMVEDMVAREIAKITGQSR